MFIKSWFFGWFLFFPGFAFSLINPSMPSIVFIHIGKELPRHLEFAVKQARLFNRCNIIVVANHSALLKGESVLESYGTHCVSCESLPRTEAHSTFLRHSSLDTSFLEGFWRVTLERFFYLQELMKTFELSDVVHLENDNMLYVDIESLLPVFRAKYPSMAIVLDNDDRCVPSFVYIANPAAMNPLAKFLGDTASSGKTDMEILACYFKIFGRAYSDQLPIIMRSYVLEQPLRSKIGHVPKDKFSFCKHEELFLSIFDGAAFGQYLGGLDPFHGTPHPGYVNESCFFDASLLTYQWKMDEEGRKIPYAIYKGDEYRINNLHIHSKNLKLFASQEDVDDEK